jgi:hypothetical protein
MFFYNTVTKEFPVFLGDAQVAYPEWDGDIKNPPAPLVWVEDAIIEWQEDKVIEDAEPKQVNGVWTRQYLIRDFTPEELARKNAPATAKAKLKALGLTDVEIEVLTAGLIR